MPAVPPRLGSGLVLLSLALAGVAEARPTGPTVFCDTYPDAPSCVGGLPACSVCHVVPPQRNVYGEAIEAALLPGQARPLSEADFMAALPAALRAAEAADSDRDGVTNGDEILAGTLPADSASVPRNGACPGRVTNPDYKVCERDLAYAFKKLNLDFCGTSPSYEALEGFRGLSTDDQQRALHDALDTCLDGEFWVGKDGAVWNLANDKIRPLRAIKQGTDSGSIVQLGDYYDDYALFVYAHTGDRDVREILTADYFVTRSAAGGRTSYNRVADRNEQNVSQERRAGLLTTRWSLVYFVMFTALPRTMAAQAYRAYLGLDIARLEGLQPVAGEPVDYDAKGVTDEACAVCHSTLDPLSYPWKNYVGLDDTPFGTYDANRTRRFRDEGPMIMRMPEAGVIFGQPVSDLVAWGRTAADSEPFARAVVKDYWRLTVGGEPSGPETDEFEALWRGLMTDDGYQVRRMLHRLIDTEAYGVP
jgi:hypothetical protein